ncbi:MAG: hypothetical protein QME51_09075 [Planctomycetota bacterium]|nr:hypothetical protein [Planctomycetota bacterium]
MDWIMFTINFVTLVAGIITVISFFREMRRENSKVLKEIREGQQKGFETLAQILKDHTVLFEKMVSPMGK